MPPGFAVGGGDDVLGSRREPHAVHDGRFQARPTGRRSSRVDRVVVTGDHRERTHVRRRSDGDVAAAAGLVSVALMTPLPGEPGRSDRALASAAADGERSSGTASTVPAVSLR